MTSTETSLASFLEAEALVALVEVVRARGSTPREEGAWMLVAPERIFGTIGGGQLEFMAIDEARQMLERLPVDGSPVARPQVAVASHGGGAASGFAEGGRMAAGAEDHQPRTAEKKSRSLDIPLGPEIGQCCGGRVELSVRPLDARLRQNLVAAARAEDARQPHVYLFGGGHVGQALAAAFSLLPLQATVVETRAEALAGMPQTVSTRLTPMPEQAVRDAPAGSAFLVLTHDHALDFLIVAEALRRSDAAYVGMIGSKTKKATFRSWYLKTAGGTDEAFARLVTPIGGDAVRDKRPAVIAALAAAEVMTALSR